MTKYAFIDTSGECNGEATYSPPLDPKPAHAIVIADDESRIGFKYEDGVWTALNNTQAAVVVAAVSVDEAYADRASIAPDFSAIKLPVGAKVTIDAELQISGQRVPGFAAEFAMPLRSTDGLMRYLDVRFADGRTTFSALMSDSKRWEVTQELINSNLPPEMHMQFAGMVITAVE